MVIRFCYKDRAQTIIQSINDQLNVDTQTKHIMKLNNHIIAKIKIRLYRQAEKSSGTNDWNIYHGIVQRVVEFFDLPG
jgi:hypothetical protein